MIRGDCPLNTLRYLWSALIIGLIAVWASENFFWTAPAADLDVAAWLLTWGMYVLAMAAVLSVVIWSGVAGLSGLFLSACLMGFVVEGIVVDEMYLAFPFQLVWTPMAWHGLVSGVAVFGLCRAGPHWRLWKHLAGLIGLGLLGAVFGAFWPVERSNLPPEYSVLIYLAGVGCLVPVANIMLDRLRVLPRPPDWVLALMPLLAATIWVAKSGMFFSLPRLVFPPIIGLTIWAMRRLGQGGPVNLYPSERPWRHLLFPIAPAITALVVVFVWESVGALPGNVVVAAVTVPLSLGWWLMLLWRARRQ